VRIHVLYTHYTSVSLHRNDLGNFYIPDLKDDEIANCMRSNHIFDSGVFESLAEYINPNSTVIDVGSSFGQMTILWAKKAKRVISFEVDPFAHSVVCMSVGANALTNVTAYRNAAWNTDGDVVFYAMPGGGTYGRNGIDMNTSQGIPTQTMRIDSLNLEDVSAIKIDAQGSDFYALQGSIETIKRCRPAVVFEHEPQRGMGASGTDYQKFIDEVDYKLIGSNWSLNNLIVPAEKTE
jgi:FkbM family methyltransferase